MTTPRSITSAAITRLKPGETLRDRECPGLLINADENGLCSWRYLRKKRDGRIFKKTFGSTATFSIIEAREGTRGFNAIIERGRDPSEIVAKKATADADELVRLAMTVRVAWGLYISALEREGNHVPKTLEMKRCRFGKENLAVSIVKASEIARAGDRGSLDKADATLRTSIASINAIVENAWTANRQWKQLCWTGGGGLLVGALGALSLLDLIG